MPALVLVDEFTASASELFAGALQDYGKVTCWAAIHSATMQSLFPLSDRSVLKLTVGYFYTPSGRQINGVGLKPDLDLEDEFKRSGPSFKWGC